MNHILCGLPKSGKSTIGKLLSDKLQCRFIDTDRLIENAYKKKMGRECSCRQIFLENGEAYFRRLEKEQLETLQKDNNTIIALGGGALNNGDNVKLLQATGWIIYLKAPLATIWKRILETGLPAYLDPQDPEGSFFSLAELRSPIYERAAHAIIETDLLTEQAIVELIIQRKEKTDGK